MRLLFDEMLHIFIIAMMTAFILLNVMAATGAFDTWNRRYLTRTRRRNPL